MKPLLVANVKVILGTKAFNSTYGMFVNNLHPLEMLDDSKIVMIFTLHTLFFNFCICGQNKYANWER